MNSNNSKTSDLHRIFLNLADKINLKRSDNYVALPKLSMYYTWKNIKSLIREINLKYQVQHGMKNFNYLIIFYIKYSRLF